MSQPTADALRQRLRATYGIPGSPTDPMARLIAARRCQAKNPPRLYSYQLRWILDDSRFKVACKARQIGFSFAAAFRALDRRLGTKGTTLWVSASERQAIEALEHVHHFTQQLKLTTTTEELPQSTARIVRLPNQSRIIALPPNPETLRGYSGDVILDELAFYADDRAVWRAAFAAITRGHQLEVISTPNGARGLFFDICKEAGIADPDEAAAVMREIYDRQRITTKIAP